MSTTIKQYPLPASKTILALAFQVSKVTWFFSCHNGTRMRPRDFKVVGMTYYLCSGITANVLKSIDISVTSKKSPNVYKSDFTGKMKHFDTFTKRTKNVGNLGKIHVAASFEKLPKVE